MSLPERFWQKVDKDGPIPAHRPELGSCWVWLSGTIQGYGQFWYEGGPHRTHRLSWVEAYGEPPPDRFVLHKCDNRKCVRPSHLFLGTHADNMRDMKEKGRANRSGRLVIPRSQVNVVLSAEGTVREIARATGVSRAHVWNIRNGKRRSA